MSEKEIKRAEVRKYAIRANDPTRYMCPVLAAKVSSYGTFSHSIEAEISCENCAHRVHQETLKLGDWKKKNCRTEGLQFKRRGRDG